MFKLAGEGIEPDILWWKWRGIPDIELAAPFGLSDIEPIGGLIASSWETLGFDKGFQEHRPVAVALAPIIG